MKNYTFQEWQRFFGIKKNFPADLNTMESTTPKELDKKKAIKGEKNPGNALAKEVATELNKLLKASNIKIVNWGIYGNIGGGKGHKPPEAKMGHPTNKNKRHHTPHTGTGGNVQEGDDGGE